MIYLSQPIFNKLSTSLADELVVARQPLYLGALNASIFNNLGPNYLEIVSALVVSGGALVSFPKLTNILESHETRFAHGKMIEIGTSSSSIAKA